MTVLAEITSGFGGITLMTAVAVLVTRIQRANILEGLMVGSGYLLGGLLFDLLTHLKRERGHRFYLTTGVITALFAIIPYWATRIFLLGLRGFMLLLPLYLYRALKGLVLSIVGVEVGIILSHTLRRSGVTQMLPPMANREEA